VTGTTRKNKVGIIRENDDSIITDTKRKISRWMEYLQELFSQNRPEQVNIRLDEGYDIMKEEVTNLLKSTKSRNAAGLDEVPFKLLKLLDDNGLNMLVNLFNTIYASGKILEEWLTSTFITLPKKNNPKECSDYQTIALMSYILKLFLKIIHQRICAKLKNEMSMTQFGFKQRMGTREALFSINSLMQRCSDYA